MPKSFDGNAARRISSPPSTPAVEAPKRPRLRVVKNEEPPVKIEAPAKIVSDAEVVQVIKAHEASLHQDTQEPTKNAKNAIKHYGTMLEAAAEKGALDPEMQQDLVTELREAKKMLEGRQAWLNHLPNPDSVEVAANWELIARMEKMLEVVHMDPEEALHMYSQEKQVKEKRTQHGGLQRLHKEEQANLEQLTGAFMDKYKLHPEQFDKEESPSGWLAKTQMWLRKQLAEGDLAVWREARRAASHAKRRVETNQKVIQGTKKPRTREDIESTMAPEIKEVLQREKTKQEKSRIGLDVLKPSASETPNTMDVSEAQRYVPHAEQLWILAHDRLSALNNEKARTQATNLLHSFEIGGNDAAETKFVYEIARLHKAAALGADARTQETIRDRIEKAASLLGIENNAEFQSSMAFRPDASSSVLKGVRERTASTRQRNARRS